jgi:PadR family transcriptional regulator AphA
VQRPDPHHRAGALHSTRGPVRSRLTATAAGRRAAAQWLSTPAEHARDIRSELMIKLALLDRAGADTQTLLLAQQMRLAPIAAALASWVRESTGFDHTLALWRHESMTATMDFLTAITPAD